LVEAAASTKHTLKNTTLIFKLLTTTQKIYSMKHFSFALFFLGIFLVTDMSAQVEYGLATVYADKFHGRRTAFGFTYDKNKLTAAHKKHPAGTRLKVTRTDNNKSVTVTVNDEGPFTVGHIIEISKAAAARLDMIELGVANVKIEVVGKENLTSPNSRRAESDPPVASRQEEETRSRTVDQAVKTYETPPDQVRQTERSSQEATTTNKTNPATNVDRIPTTTEEPKTIDVQEEKSDQPELAGKEYSKYGLHKVMVSQPEPGFGVQVMALNTYESVFPQIAKYQSRGFKDIYLTVDPTNATYPYKLILGMYEEEASAKKYSSDLRAKYGIKGFVVGNEFTNYFYKINLLKPEMEGYGVQVMSLSSYENVLEQIANYENRGFKNIYMNVEQGQGRSNYKIILGMFDNPDSANRYKNDLIRKYKVNGFVSSFIKP
jgi:rare lipoprotein A